MPSHDDGRVFTRHNLAAKLRKPGHRPRVVENLIYPGRMHTLAGPPEAGKTSLALWLMLAAMRTGHPVLMVDEEGGPDVASDLLRGMGADPDLIENLMWYLPFPSGGRWAQPEFDAIHALIGEVHPVLTVWDSSAAIMAAGGVRENDTGEVLRLWSRLWVPVSRALGSAVLVIDHDAKEGFDSRYARGSGAKLAIADVGIKTVAIRPFSRDTDGLLRVTITKDRPGCLHRFWDVHVRHDPLAFEFVPATAGREDAGDMPPAMRKIHEILTDYPATIRELIDRLVDQFGHGLKRETMSRSLNDLLAAGLADRIDQGAGRDALWRLPATRAEPVTEPAPAEPQPKLEGYAW